MTNQNTNAGFNTVNIDAAMSDGASALDRIDSEIRGPFLTAIQEQESHQPIVDFLATVAAAKALKDDADSALQVFGNTVYGGSRRFIRNGFGLDVVSVKGGVSLQVATDTTRHFFPLPEGKTLAEITESGEWMTNAVKKIAFESSAHLVGQDTVVNFDPAKAAKGQPQATIDGIALANANWQDTLTERAGRYCVEFTYYLVHRDLVMSAENFKRISIDNPITGSLERWETPPAGQHAALSKAAAAALAKHAKAQSENEKTEHRLAFFAALGAICDGLNATGGATVDASGIDQRFKPATNDATEESGGDSVTDETATDETASDDSNGAPDESKAA